MFSYYVYTLTNNIMSDNVNVFYYLFNLNHRLNAQLLIINNSWYTELKNREYK